ncbi:MAG: DUF4129 domain-containing protein [Methanomicrobiales archaeon]
MKLIPVILAALACAFLIGLVPSITTPELYTPEMDAATPLHQNPAVLRQISQSEEDVLLPLMQEMLGSSREVVINILVKDFDSAAEDLEEYRSALSQMNNLVVRLDAEESDLEEFRQNMAENRENLQNLFNHTRRFSDLQRLEIQYRDADDPNKLYSVMYEGEALRRQIAQDYQEYAGLREQVVSSGGTFELNTSAYEESVEEYGEVVREVEVVQENRTGTISREVEPPARSLSLSVVPDTGGYGDRLVLQGALTGPDPAGTPIRVMVDSRPRTSLTTAASGLYSTTYRIGKVRAGTHLVYVQGGDLFSPVRTFTVVERGTALTLTASLQGTSAVLSGTLTAAGVPVAGAPIRIGSDTTDIARATTGPAGVYRVNATLAPGTHTLTARFDDPDFPLTPATSAPVEVEATESVGLPLTIAITLLFLILAAAGAVMYLRRPPRETPTVTLQNAPPPPVPDKEPAPEPEITVDELVSAGAYEEAVFRLYRRLARRLAERHGIDRPETLTPRELARRCGDPPALAAFVHEYEEIRYGGRVPDAETISRLRERAEVID